MLKDELKSDIYKRVGEEHPGDDARLSDMMPDNGLIIIVAIVILSVTIIIAAVTLTIFGPAAGSTPLIITLLAAIAPTIVALLALLQAKRSTEKTQQLHIAVNSRLSQLLETSSALATANARLEGENTARALATKTARDLENATAAPPPPVVPKNLPAVVIVQARDATDDERHKVD